MTQTPSSASSAQPSSPVRPETPEGCVAGKSLSPLSLRKRLLFLSVLAFFSLIFALLAAEGVLRLVWPQPLAAPLYRETEFGYSLLPNLRDESTQSDAGVSYRLSTNPMGFRGRREIAVQPPPGTLRVLVLGDSFPFGVGVPDTDCFPVLAESLLNTAPTSETQTAPPSPAWEVVNLGVPGWGTENALAFWQQNGRDLQADLLVLAFYKNDFSDNMRHELFQVQDGKVVASPRSNPSFLKRVARAVPFYRFLCGHSHLVNFVRRALVVRESASHSVPPSGASETVSSESSKPTADSGEGATWEAKRQVWAVQLAREKSVYRALMESLLQDAKSRKIPVLILLLAGTEDLVYPWPSDQLKEATRLAREWASAGLTDYLETLEVVRGAEQAGTPIFLPKDGHFSAEGNRLVAERLAEKIRKMRLSDSQPDKSQQEGAP